MCGIYRGKWVFQSTLPARGSDAMYTFDDKIMDISIHAPREGERRRDLFYRRPDPYFNPRSPRGGATRDCPSQWRGRGISIHAPREGERHLRGRCHRSVSLFQSTLPARGSDHGTHIHNVPRLYFNPRSPRGGATRSCSSAVGGIVGFQSTLPARGSDGC